MLWLCTAWIILALCYLVTLSLSVIPDEKLPHVPCADIRACNHTAYNATSIDRKHAMHLEIPYGHLPSGIHHSSFLSFMEKYNRVYPPGSQVFYDKYQIFLNAQHQPWGEAQGDSTLRPIPNGATKRSSVERHKNLNAITFSSNLTNAAYYGINQFSDLTPEEFASTYLKSYPSHTYGKPVNISAQQQPLPLRFDWREKKFVTRVKNQMSCGACWAFSIVEAVESAYAIKGHPLEELSVQQVIDCSYLDFGCNGGSTDSALKWLYETKTKLVRASEYNFKAKTGLCHFFHSAEFGVSIKGYETHGFGGYEEEMMRKLIELGPLVVIVDAISWQDYLGGIIQHHCSSGAPNHAVLVIGFDKTGDIPYWIVQNSWGTSWGADGYVYIKMGENVCGIADFVSVPLL